MKKNIVHISIFILSITISIAQEKISLEEVFKRIEKNNPALLSYQNRINAANELVNGAKAWMAPMSQIEFGKNPYSLDLKNGTFPTAISIRQDITNPKKLEAKEDYLKSLSVINQNEGDFYKIQLFAEAKSAYYARYISEKRIHVLEESIKIMQWMVELSEKQAAISKGEIANVYRMQARKSELETMIIHEQNMIKSNNVTLNYLMNVDLSQSFSIDTTGLRKTYHITSNYLMKDSVACKRSDIMRMNAEINSMKLNQSLMASRSKPDFGVILLHETMFNNAKDRYSIMGMMTIPIVPWSAKGYKSEVKAMSFSIDAMEQQKQNMINMASQMISMSLIELESEYKELENYEKKILPSYKKGLDANLLSYSQNTSELNMTLLAWDDYQMAQINYLKHLETWFKVQTDYEKEMQIR